MILQRYLHNQYLNVLQEFETDVFAGGGANPPLYKLYCLETKQCNRGF